MTSPSRERPSTTARRLRPAALDRCMYCLARARGRTEEHLIPRALGGRATLRDAVCEPCRRLTGRLEQATLDRVFAVPKTLLALKRRRARGKGPERLPVVALEGGVAAGELTAATFPRGFWLPAFGRAGLLEGVERGTQPAFVEPVACRLDLGSPARHAVAAAVLPDPRAYAYSIAKWAYALAVAERGLDCCDMQPLRDLMLGRREDPFRFVGTPSPRVPASRAWLHDFELRECGPWLTVRLALFAAAGMAPYEVVVGALDAFSSPAPAAA